MKNRVKKEIPWYQRTFRWGQTNLTEMDPVCSDLEWWRDYWRKTRVQGVIVNAGGIVAYYPSSFKFQYRAKGLGDRDLFGEFLSAARKDGLTVLARMDINRTAKQFYDAHPGWFAVNPQGVPFISGGHYFTCINSAYYKEYIPRVLKEIITLYHPEGFTDNSWTGVSRQTICHCENCKKKFDRDCGLNLPISLNWEDPTYRKWIKWSYGCRIENWDLFNKITREFGGNDCLWLGMVNADPINTYAYTFCDLKEVGERAKIIMCDHQSRDKLNGFEQNSLNGSLLHGLAGEDKIILESMANYIRGIRTFRRGSNPPKETRLWMVEGIAGGISPWFHHVGAVQEDRRQFENMAPVMRWHERNEDFLYNRQLVANVGLIWSQDNICFHGRDEAEEKVALPWHGFVRALTRARILFMPVHADHIAREAKNLKVLILSDLAAMSDKQCRAVQGFVESGGSLVFTGASASLDEWGEERPEFPLESITGIKYLHQAEGASDKQSSDWTFYNAHNYFRLPEERHPMLSGFENTDILSFGGRINTIEAGGQMKAIATYIPAFPIYPPEFSWMREPRTDIPAILGGEHSSGGRMIYFAGDVDRCYGRAHLPDHGDLLANAVRWAAFEEFPLKVEGPGYLDCKLYRQNRRLILHLVNLSGCNQNPGYVEEYLPVGPLAVSFKINDFIPECASMKVSGLKIKPEINNFWAIVHIDSLVDHELIVLE